MRVRFAATVSNPCPGVLASSPRGNLRACGSIVLSAAQCSSFSREIQWRAFDSMAVSNKRLSLYLSHGRQVAENVILLR
jgi:hypothetical protein